MRVKTMTLHEGMRYGLSQFPNFSATGSIIGMKKLYYGKDALLVRCGGFIYKVTADIYDMAH